MNDHKMQYVHLWWRSGEGILFDDATSLPTRGEAKPRAVDLRLPTKLTRADKRPKHIFLLGEHPIINCWEIHYWQGEPHKTDKRRTSGGGHKADKLWPGHIVTNFFIVKKYLQKFFLIYLFKIKFHF